MKKKIVAVLMTALMAGGLLAGCGNSGASSSGSGGEDFKGWRYADCYVRGNGGRYLY